MPSSRLPLLCLNLFFCCTTVLPFASADERKVVISEFMAKNSSGLKDSGGKYTDWIEVLNYGDALEDLSGCYLTDDLKELSKWKIPNEVVVEPGKRILIFASGKAKSSNGSLHAGFKLNSKGDYLAIVDTDGETVIHSYGPKFPKQKSDKSYGLAPNWQTNGQAEMFFDIATPGEPNVSRSSVKSVKLSHKRGLYDRPFALTLKCSTADAEIRYTIDGSTPSSDDGLIYDGPVKIDRSVSLRVAAFKPGSNPSRIKTHTFLLPRRIAKQSPDGLPPEGFPFHWGANRIDYGMDRTITESPEYAEKVIAGLRSLPSYSITIKMDDMFGEEEGIYANPQNDGREWERPCSLELIQPDSSDGFQIDCGIRIRGGFSRSPRNPKHAFRFFFRKQYGEAKLEHRLFGKRGAKQFDNIDLRTFQNYSWSFSGDKRGIFLRDQFSRDLQEAMGQPAARGDFCHLYINGHYWGLYDTCERPKASYGAEYFKGKREDFDVVKQGRDNGMAVMATDGNLDAWQDQWKQATAGLESNAAYFRLMGCNQDGTRNPDYPVLLDPENLIDYMLVIFFAGNFDSPVTKFAGNRYPNNWHGMRNRNGDEGFRYFVWDAEHTLFDIEEDRTGPFPAGEDFETSNPQWVYQQCLDNAEFRLKVADRVYKHFYNDGVLAPDSVTERFRKRAAEIETAVVCESARWGDSTLGGNAFNVDGSRAKESVCTQEDWQNEINRIANEYLPVRTKHVLGQLYRQGVVLDVDPPQLNQLGGKVDRDFELQLTSPHGKIFVTTNGKDPRSIGGEKSTSAKEVTESLRLTKNTVVKARTLLDGDWSALAEATFKVQ